MHQQKMHSSLKVPTQHFSEVEVWTLDHCDTLILVFSGQASGVRRMACMPKYSLVCRGVHGQLNEGTTKRISSYPGNIRLNPEFYKAGSLLLGYITTVVYAQTLTCARAVCSTVEIIAY